MAGHEASGRGVFRLGYVPGATPGKWARTFRARHRDVTLELVPLAAAHAEHAVVVGDVDAAILRPPVDRGVLHAIPLYAEDPVVVVARDHLLAALDEAEPVDPDDLAHETLVQAADDVLTWAGAPGAAEDAIAPPGKAPSHVPATTSEAIELVAAGVGVLVVPLSLARLHHRKDVVARPFPAGPKAPVALAWAIEREDDRTEDLIGIVRGRTVNSSRGRPSERAREQRARPARSASPRRRRRGPRRRR